MKFHRPTFCLFTFFFIAFSGCLSSGSGLEIKIPASWEKECHYTTSFDGSMPCSFNSTNLELPKPDTAVCTSQFSANGVSIEFSYDALRMESWFSYESKLTPLSGIIYSDDSITQFIDGPKAASFPIPWKERDGVVGISIYQDFLFHGRGVEIGPDQGSQEFLVEDGDIFTITRWQVRDQVIYIGYSEEGVLMPIGTDSWIDESGAEPSISSFKKFIHGSGFNTSSPAGCLASLQE